MLDEPANGLDPEGIQWIRNTLKELAAEGRTVFVSSHVMSEMALTADHLIVIGRGRLIADSVWTSSFDRRRRTLVLVRSPQVTELAEALAGPGVTVEPSTRAPSGERADRGAGRRDGRSHGIVLHELTPPQPHSRRRSWTSPATTSSSTLRRPPEHEQVSHERGLDVARMGWTPEGHAGPGRRLGVDEAPLAPLDALVAARRGRVHDRAALPVRRRHRGPLEPHEPPREADRNPIEIATAGVNLSQLAIGVLGVLIITGEYSTGMIRASFGAVPKRLPVLWARSPSSPRSRSC